MTRGVWCVALWLVAAVAVAATEPTAVWRAPAAILPRIDSIEDTAQQKRSLPSAVHVLIGVKTSLVHGASSRRAIRETWGSLASPDEARVVFLGCSPDLTQLNASDAERMQREIAQETQRYGDLLVHELVGCRDAYEELANKVLAFFQWTTSQRQPRDTKAFVMVVDDDVYLRIDLLLRLLQDPRVDKTRFYGGQVWAAQYGRAMEPYRKPQHHKYYLSYDQYPMSQLPPFANGPHYIASADIAAFLGSHRDMFHGVGGHRDGRDGAALDDVSMALWLLALQIHPMHLPQFQNLRDSMCRNELVSYADISVDGLRHIHNNLMQNRSFCDGFTYATWLKRSPSNGPATRPDEDLRLSSLTISWHSELDALTDDVHVSLELRTIEKSESVRINYVPAQASVFSVCAVAYDLGNAKSVIRDISMNAFCRQFIAALRVAATHAPRSRVLYALVLHNLQSDVVIPTLVVRMSPMPRSAKSVIECLLTQAYRGAEVLMFDETANTAVATFRPPEIVFFTLEGKGDEMQSPDAIVDAMSEKYPSSRLVLVLLSHHHASIKSTRVVVLSLGGQLTSSDDARAISITAASVSFGASELFTPCDLLEPFHSRENVVAFSQDVSTSAPFQFRRFCVDHYTQPDECYLPHREYFSRLMNAMDSVDTIGACARAQHLGSNATSRLAFDRLVESYRNFRFVIAFENSVRPFEEINDKIVAAFLAGAIPIYYGHSETDLHAFNPYAYVNCGSFESLRACASYVHVIHSTPRLYERMRQEVPISNTTAFVEIFSWHPAVSQFALENQHVGIKTAIQQLKERLDQS